MTFRHAPVVCVVLAAGGGSRFHGPTHKLLAPFGDTTVVGAAVRQALAADVGPLVVVSGAVDLRGALRDATGDDAPITIIDHPGWRDGQATSLRVAVDAAEQLGAESVVVGLGDQPYVEPEAWRLVAAGTAPISIATYDGRRRNPVRLHRSVWPALADTGDEGARSLVRMHPELVEEIPCPGSPDDIDTQEDLPPWPKRS